MAGAPPQTPLGELTTLPQTLSRLRGDRRLRRLNSRAFVTRLSFAVPSLSVAPPLLTSVAPAASREFFLRQFYQKDTSHVSKKNLFIDFGDNFNFGELVFLASLIVGELACRRVGLSASLSVSELVCRRVGLSASCP